MWIYTIYVFYKLWEIYLEKPALAVASAPVISERENNVPSGKDTPVVTSAKKK